MAGCTWDLLALRLSRTVGTVQVLIVGFVIQSSPPAFLFSPFLQALAVSLTNDLV